MTNSVALKQDRAPDVQAIDPKPTGALLDQFAKAQSDVLQSNINSLTEYQKNAGDNVLDKLSKQFTESGGEAGKEIGKMMAQIKQNADKEMAKFAEALPSIKSGLDVGNSMMFQLTNEMDASIGETDEYKYYNE
jgi:hypothetical protein